MTEKELQELEQSVIRRLQHYVGCDEEGVRKTMRLVYPAFSCNGNALYYLSDILSEKGY